MNGAMPFRAKYRPAKKMLDKKNGAMVEELPCSERQKEKR
jgi:hypothetical protein